MANSGFELGGGGAHIHRVSYSVRSALHARGVLVWSGTQTLGVLFPQKLISTCVHQGRVWANTINIDIIPYI